MQCKNKRFLRCHDLYHDCLFLATCLTSLMATQHCKTKPEQTARTKWAIQIANYVELCYNTNASNSERLRPHCSKEVNCMCVGILLSACTWCTSWFAKPFSLSFIASFIQITARCYLHRFNCRHSKFNCETYWNTFAAMSLTKSIVGCFSYLRYAVL